MNIDTTELLLQYDIQHENATTEYIEEGNCHTVR